MSSKAEIIDCSDRMIVNSLYEKMGRALMAKAYSILKSQDLAAEIVQDCFLKLWQKAGEMPNEKAIYSWLYKTCQNACIDYLRSAKHRYEQSAGEATVDIFPDQGSSIGDKVVSYQTLKIYLGALKERDAQILVYAYMDEMTQQEVADFLKISRKTVQRSLASTEKIIKKLREQHGH